MHATRIVAYTYQADHHCPECIRKGFATDAAQAAGHLRPLDTETTLDNAARARGIDRHNERSFDTRDFPKIAFANQVNQEGYEHCGTCGDCLGHDLSDCQPHGHPIGQCPGFNFCENPWHISGCDPYWQYGDESDNDISGSPTAELDAVEKRLWEGPDEPSEVWTRPTTDHQWRLED